MAPRGSDRLLGQDRTARALSSSLRRDFATAFQASSGRNPEPDPMLHVLFEAVAVQLSRIYDEAEETFPDRVVDDLVAALGLPAFSAVPAQTVVAFDEVETREALTADNEIIGYSDQGEEIPFRADVGIDLIPASLRFAAVVEGGKLCTVAGVTLDEHGTPLPRAVVPCPGARAPMLLLAIDSADGHISRLGIHLDTKPRHGEVAIAFTRSPWHVLSADGAITERGTLVSRATRGGVRALEWVQSRPGEAIEDPHHPGLNLEIAEGPLGHQCFVLPAIPLELREKCPPPQLIRSQLQRVVPEEFIESVTRPLIWLAVSLPAGVTNVDDSLQGVTLNATTASNVEVLSEHVTFPAPGGADGRSTAVAFVRDAAAAPEDEKGLVLAVRPEGARDRFLLGAQRVLGEDNEPYVPEGDLLAAPTAGRFRIDGDRIFLRAAVRRTGRRDRTAHLRLLFTDGARGNKVGTGRVSRVTQLANPITRVTNLADSQGGMNPPSYELRRERLAEILRSRERAVTPADFHVLVRAIEPRVKGVGVEYQASIVDRRLQPVHLVHVTVSRSDFSPDAPQTEFPRLRDMLERHLNARVLLGHVVRVQLEDVP